MKKNVFSPVHVRTKKLSDGRQSIYLDTCIDGQRVKEYLGLYLVPENNRADKAANKATMQLVEDVRARRMVDIQDGKFNINDREAGKVILIEWLEEQRKYYHDHGNNNYSKTIHNLIKHLTIFAPKMQLKGVTPSFLRKFLEYLNGDINKYGGKLSPDTVYTYFTVLSILMNKAVRLNMIVANPFHKLSKAEKPQRHTKKREYLTLEEVKKLAETPCDDWRVKHAFLFCCFTGLRYIDVSRLKWKHIVKVSDDEYQIEVMQQKTKEPVYVPLSENARKWIPEQGINGRENYVFQFRDRSIIYDYLNKWAQAAGIEKHVTFHMRSHNKIFY